MEIPLNEVVHFKVTTRDPETASKSDADSVPTFDVFEEAVDVAIVSGNLTNVEIGLYRGTFTVSAANGFEVGRWYSVRAAATVNDFEDQCTPMLFRVLPAEPAPGYPDLSGTSVKDATDVSSSLVVIAGMLATIAGFIDTEITTLLNRIGAFTGSGVNTVLGFLKAMMSKVASTPSDVGGTFSATTDSLEAIADELGNTGTGARTVTITVNDGAAVLQNAIVRLSQGAETYVGTTNASGVVVFAVDDATWTVGITKVGYSFTPTTLVVNGDEVVTYSMTSIVIPAPADPAFCTLAIRVWGTNGAVAVGVNVKTQIAEPPDGEGEFFNSSVVTDATGADGYATFTIPRGCSVKYWVGSSEKNLDSVATNASVVYVENHIGIPV